MGATALLYVFKSDSNSSKNNGISPNAEKVTPSIDSVDEANNIFRVSSREIINPIDQNQEFEVSSRVNDEKSEVSNTVVVAEEPLNIATSEAKVHTKHEVSPSKMLPEVNCQKMTEKEVFDALFSHEYKFSSQDFSEKEKVGEGKYGEVYKATIRGCTIAMKCGSTVVSEYNFYKDVKGEEIEELLPLYGSVTMDDRTCVLMKYVPDGDLSKFQYSDDILQETLLAAKQIATGIKKLHDRGYIMMDLKPLNILYDKTEKKIYLIDFGQITDISSGNLWHKGSFYFISPEQFNTFVGSRSCLDFESDVWAFGQTLRHMIKPPNVSIAYTDDKYNNIYEILENGPTPNWSSLPKPLNTLVRDCTHVIDVKRPTMNQVIERLEHMIKNGKDTPDTPVMIFESLDSALKSSRESFTNNYASKTKQFKIYHSQYLNSLNMMTPHKEFIDFEYLNIEKSLRIIFNREKEIFENNENRAGEYGFYSAKLGDQNVFLYSIKCDSNMKEINDSIEDIQKISIMNERTLKSLKEIYDDEDMKPRRQFREISKLCRFGELLNAGKILGFSMAVSSTERISKLFIVVEAKSPTDDYKKLMEKYEILKKQFEDYD
ncbi:kinase-like protein [Rozella allomycis CSF55]|uniref:Kinase-like protein n=1 Tax=Rozella allomycis (strain CSF55) TaxID=988480 RepID=A0A4P9YLD4_ROZAC|nr:kinase-like protein [Rozella allomycis CSF55]